ncbi:hypothetical protein HDV00_000059 [Rhizophlyctis rosea]|nr:hypothetical protein HDV00_000059 [Rhizophlyctis rosea]
MLQPIKNLQTRLEFLLFWACDHTGDIRNEVRPALCEDSNEGDEATMPFSTTVDEVGRLNDLRKEYSNFDNVCPPDVYFALSEQLVNACKKERWVLEAVDRAQGHETVAADRGRSLKSVRFSPFSRHNTWTSTQTTPTI